MKVTAQEEYGLRCLLQIARGVSLGYATIGEVAEREALTAAYVGKLMRVLRQGGLVKSIRGQKGGFRLARPAGEISISEVLRVLGGPLYSDAFCERFTGNRCQCVHVVDCAVRALWSGLAREVEGILGRCKLSDLLCDERRMSAWVAGCAGAPGARLAVMPGSNP